MQSFRLDPPEHYLLRARLVQSMEELDVPSCRDNESTEPEHVRTKHTLTIFNLGWRQRFKISYSIDNSMCGICEHMDYLRCDGGEDAKEIVFPLGEMYWLGQEKTLARAISWLPEDSSPDFNLIIKITASHDPMSPAPAEDSIDLTAHTRFRK